MRASEQDATASSGLPFDVEMFPSNQTPAPAQLVKEPRQDAPMAAMSTKPRIEEVDALRGLMLVWMTFTHLPTILSTYVNQPLGYFAATEGFIFLSALFTGRICSSLAERAGNLAMSLNMWKRAGRLYVYQLLLLIFAFVIEAPIAAHGNRPAVHNLLNYYFTVGHWRAFFHGALMIYRPPLLDILPIYIIFLAITPFAVLLGKRLGWKYVFVGGITFWVLAQFGFRNTAYNWLIHVFHLQIPLSEMGAFDLWAWQLWWLVGLWAGFRWAKGDLHIERWARKVTVPAAVIVLFFMGLRYTQLATDLDFGKFWPLFDKWKFGLFRLIDFTAMAMLAVRFHTLLKPLAIRPLVMLGQASLQVFCVHLLCVFFALTTLGNNDVLTGWKGAALVAGSLSALLLTAYITTRRRMRSRVYTRQKAPSAICY